jgi:sarcosine oxidase subunit gamma
MQAEFQMRASPLGKMTSGPPALSAPQPASLTLVDAPERPVLSADAILSLAPSRWLAVYEDDATPEPPPEAAAVVDTSHGWFRIRVSGRHSREILSAGIRIDLHEEEFPMGTGAPTAFRDIPVILHAIAEESFDLYVLRSYAASLWEWLADTAMGIG